MWRPRGGRQTAMAPPDRDRVGGHRRERGARMKAVVCPRYGPPDVLEIREIPRPQPKAHELLVKVHATTVTRTDCGILRADPFFLRFFMGFRRPKTSILGMDFAGEIEEVGPAVTSFKPGDRVFGMLPGVHGAHAEYVCASEKGPVATLPPGIPFPEAVVCEGAWYANNALIAFGLEPGDEVLIYGASGAIGTSAVQLAKLHGAAVTAVVATRHLDLVRSLGADRSIDYTVQDFTRVPERFDYVFDAVGKTTYFRCRKLLKPDGSFCSTDLGPGGQNPLLAIWSSLTKSNRVLFPLPKGAGAFVGFLRDAMESDSFRAVIDREYALEEIIDAYRYVESGQKTGIVVINVPSATDSKTVSRSANPR